MRNGLSTTAVQGDILVIGGARIRVASAKEVALQALTRGVTIRRSGRTSYVTVQNGSTYEAVVTRKKRGVLATIVSGDADIMIEQQRDKHVLARRRRRTLAFTS